MASDGPVYEAVLAAHVLSAVIGFGSILVTGGYAQLARPRLGVTTGTSWAPPEAVRRYFRPGANLASRLIFAVPALGLVLAGLGGWKDLHQMWLWIGSGLWVAAAGAAAGLVWPAEARIQALVHRLGQGGGGGGSQDASVPAVGANLARAGRRAVAGSALADLAAAAALVIMIARPGS
jgi:hypothetical protein